MILLPDGRSEREVLDAELNANRELKRITHAYQACARALYPKLSPKVKREVTPMLQQLRDFPSLPGAWSRL